MNLIKLAYFSLYRRLKDYPCQSEIVYYCSINELSLKTYMLSPLAKRWNFIIHHYMEGKCIEHIARMSHYVELPMTRERIKQMLNKFIRKKGVIWYV